MERLVHICNGDSTADTLSLAELPGEIRVWADALDLGPVLPVADDESYRARAEFWASRVGGSPEDHRKKLAEYDRSVDEALAAEEVVLWYEHDLFDQLALARLLARFARKGLPAQLTIVSIDRHPEVPNFLGLGELQPHQLAELWPRRTPLSRDAIDEAITAWIAVTAADPRALPFLTRRIKAMPFLAGALERHLEELPDPQSGAIPHGAPGPRRHRARRGRAGAAVEGCARERSSVHDDRRDPARDAADPRALRTGGG
jgi:hypothetical protein